MIKIEMAYFQKAIFLFVLFFLKNIQGIWSLEMLLGLLIFEINFLSDFLVLFFFERNYRNFLFMGFNFFGLYLKNLLFNIQIFLWNTMSIVVFWLWKLLEKLALEYLLLKVFFLWVINDIIIPLNGQIRNFLRFLIFIDWLFVE